jgi:hypothetical protein
LLEADAGLAAIVWVVLLIGAMIVVGFTYLFGMRTTVVHTLMVAALGLTIALVLFTVGALDYPFRGDVWVGPDAFESVAGELREQPAERPLIEVVRLE